VSAQAGWYPDSHLTGTQRYWDGARWTDHVAPLTTVPASSKPEKIEIGGIIMAALLPGIGLIVGLIMLIRKRPKTGALMIGASILSFFVLRLAFALG
jgi:Protein of unknown function (DUF2510)